MADILTYLAQVLCPTSNSFSACQQFINEFASQGVIYQLMYFLFFPSIFIIVFVYTMTRAAPFLHSHGGLQMLMSLAIYAYIIISGWYPAALFLARIWFVVIIVLFGLWYFIGRHFGNGGGGGGSGAGGSLLGTGAGGVSGKLLGFARKDVPRKIRAIKSGIKRIDAMVKMIESGQDSGKVLESLGFKEAEVMNDIKELRNFGIKYWPIANKLEKEVTDLTIKIQKKKRQADEKLYKKAA